MKITSAFDRKALNNRKSHSATILVRSLPVLILLSCGLVSISAFGRVMTSPTFTNSVYCGGWCGVIHGPMLGIPGYPVFANGLHYDGPYHYEGGGNPGFSSEVDAPINDAELLYSIPYMDTAEAGFYVDRKDTVMAVVYDGPSSNVNYVVLMFAPYVSESWWPVSAVDGSHLSEAQLKRLTDTQEFADKIKHLFSEQQAEYRAELRKEATGGDGQPLGRTSGIQGGGRSDTIGGYDRWSGVSIRVVGASFPMVTIRKLRHVK